MNYAYISSYFKLFASNKDTMNIIVCIIEKFQENKKILDFNLENRYKIK